jgi:hypothetical protein
MRQYVFRLPGALELEGMKVCQPHFLHFAAERMTQSEIARGFESTNIPVHKDNRVCLVVNIKSRSAPRLDEKKVDSGTVISWIDL